MDPDSAECEDVNMAPVKKTLGPLGHTFLKDWRDHVGLDQEMAAAKLNISRTLLSKIEGSKSPYTQRHLEAAAEIYGREPWELIKVDPNDKGSFWSLFRQAEKLTGKDRKRLRDIIDAALS
ncbi:MAG: helix-turn-helix transcriptional regulator [Mesorhizobium sp.]|nr:MAG: helix-turn-helix transcriptional regulator [Mesorhizobium sp.]